MTHETAAKPLAQVNKEIAGYALKLSKLQSLENGFEFITTLLDMTELSFQHSINAQSSIALLCDNITKFSWINENQGVDELKVRFATLLKKLRENHSKLFSLSYAHTADNFIKKIFPPTPEVIEEEAEPEYPSAPAMTPPREHSPPVDFVSQAESMKKQRTASPEPSAAAAQPAQEFPDSLRLSLEKSSSRSSSSGMRSKK